MPSAAEHASERVLEIAFAAIGCNDPPRAFVAATFGVIRILFRREFHSDILGILNS